MTAAEPRAEPHAEPRAEPLIVCAGKGGAQGPMPPHRLLAWGVSYNREYHPNSQRRARRASRPVGACVWTLVFPVYIHLYGTPKQLKRHHATSCVCWGFASRSHDRLLSTWGVSYSDATTTLSLSALAGGASATYM